MPEEADAELVRANDGSACPACGGPLPWMLVGRMLPDDAFAITRCDHTVQITTPEES